MMSLLVRIGQAMSMQVGCLLKVVRKVSTRPGQHLMFTIALLMSGYCKTQCVTVTDGSSYSYF